MRFKWIKGLLPAVWLCTACAGLHRAPRVAAPLCVLRAADSVGTVTEWTAEIHFARADFTGICVLRRTAGGAAGTVVNEFGVRAFDFTYDAQHRRVQLAQIMPMLDKWYIRRTLRRDWCALLEQLCDTTQADYRNARRLSSHPPPSCCPCNSSIVSSAWGIVAKKASKRFSTWSFVPNISSIVPISPAILSRRAFV